MMMMMMMMMIFFELQVAAVKVFVKRCVAWLFKTLANNN